MSTRREDKSLFRIREAEEFLGVSRAQVYRLIDAGELRRVKIGKSARIPRASLEALVARLEDELAHDDA